MELSGRKMAESLGLQSQEEENVVLPGQYQISPPRGKGVDMLKWYWELCVVKLITLVTVEL